VHGPSGTHILRAFPRGRKPSPEEGHVQNVGIHQRRGKASLKKKKSFFFSETKLTKFEQK
jgi:hypothetical protein